jgi:preprotein translocase subunit YajC
MNLLSQLPDLLAMAPNPSTPGAPQQPAWVQMVPLLLAVVLFYFLLIRPQMKARKEQDNLVNSIKSGDDVVTSSGILGTVTNVKDKTVIVKIADNVKIEILKSAISSVNKPTGEAKPL